MRVFGKHEYVEIKVDDLAVLPQVRKTKNIKFAELVDSIMDKGLINPIDVVMLSEENFLLHINFINELWNKQIKIDSFKKINGFYYVVIAGHTRVLAIKEISKTTKEECSIFVKVHNVSSSEEIIAIQLDENILSEPKIEERAIAIIETYKLGLITKKWNNPNEFFIQNETKFSRRVLRDALAFSLLPEEVQEYVWASNIPYSVGIELGRMYELIEKYEEEFSYDKDAVSKGVKLRYAILIGELQNSKSIKHSLLFLKGQVNQLNKHFMPSEIVQEDMFSLWESGAERQANLHANQQLAEYRKVVNQLSGLPFSYYVDYLRLNTNLTNENHQKDIEAVRKLYEEHIQIQKNK